MKKSFFCITLIAVLALVMAFSVSAAEMMTAEAQFCETPPNMDPAVVDESWGSVAAHVDKDSPNSELHIYKKGLNPEDGLDIYARWDNEYLYLCYVSPDDDPIGSNEYWKGDGYMSVMLPGNDVHYSEDPVDAVFTYTWSIDVDLKHVTTFGAADLYDPTIVFSDGMMIAKLRVPLYDMGFRRDEDKTGMTIAVRLVRLSARKGENALSGWLAWGKFYETAILPTEPDTLADGSNIIRLVKSAAEEEPEPVKEPEEEPTTEPVFEFRADDQPAEYAKKEVTEAIRAGLVPGSLCKNFTSPVTRGEVAEMFIRLLEMLYGKPIDDILAERGLEPDYSVFSDTADKNVIAANALGIINGTGNGKFSPDGTLKRAQIAAIINRVAKDTGVKTDGFTHSFTDITENYAWADAELGWPVHAEIIKGVGEGRFNPAGELKTQDAILITYRAFKALSQN